MSVSSILLAIYCIAL